MNLTQHAANAILNGTTMPATLHVQQHTGNPGTAGTANVAADDRRVAFTRTTATVGASENVALLEWIANPTGENITHVSLWSAASGGNPWWIGAPIGAPVLTVTGQTTEIPIGTLDLTITTWS